MIVSGQITRNKALELIQEPLYDEQELVNDCDYFCNKLGISKFEFEAFLNLPNAKYSDFKNWDSMLKYVDFARESYYFISQIFKFK